MTSELLSAAAQAGGIPRGWSANDLAELADHHHLLAVRSRTYATAEWHLRNRATIRDLIETMAQG